MENNKKFIFVLRLSLENAAFEDYQCFAIAEILRNIAITIEGSLIEETKYKNILDLNGNIAGKYAIIKG